MVAFVALSELVLTLLADTVFRVAAPAEMLAADSVCTDWFLIVSDPMLALVTDM